jgi:hypothetical protein
MARRLAPADLASSREEGPHHARTHGGKTMTGMAQALGLPVSRVSRLIAAVEAKGKA